MTLEEIVNSLKSTGQDYGQLFNNNPKYTAVASNVTKGFENLVPPQFANTQDAKSQEYSKKLAEWALGNGMGMSGMALSTKIPNTIKDNLNADLLKKYLSTGKLSPKEIAQYEANGLAMETPQLQRYNVANAMANPERQSYMSTSDVPVYHGRTHKDIRYGEKSDLTSLQSGIGKAEGERLFSSDNPYLASSYAGTIHEQPAIYPLVAKSNDIYSAGFPMPSDNEISAMSENEISKLLDNIKSYNLNLDKNRIVNNGIMDADIANKNTVKFNQIIDNPSYRPLQEFPTDVYASKSGLRSRFAAFDPLRKNSSSLLASGLLGALLFNNENKTSENK
mgnify:CR=1 FL=1